MMPSSRMTVSDRISQVRSRALGAQRCAGCGGERTLAHWRRTWRTGRTIVKLFS